MELEIVLYGHPALRTKGQKIRRIDDDLRQFAADMLDTMYAANGVGLAAHQVARPIQLTVIDIHGVEDRPSRMWMDGKEVNPLDHMPLVLLNPSIELLGHPETGIEGCLSFPQITAEISRPSRVKVSARNLDGNPIAFEAEGLLSRAVQHEVDHLNGILFIDRMSSATKAAIKSKLKRLQQ